MKEKSPGTRRLASTCYRNTCRRSPTGPAGNNRSLNGRWYGSPVCSQHAHAFSISAVALAFIPLPTFSSWQILSPLSTRSVMTSLKWCWQIRNGGTTGQVSSSHVADDAPMVGGKPDNDLAEEVRTQLTTVPKRHIKSMREYLGWRVFTLMAR